MQEDEACSIRRSDRSGTLGVKNLKRALDRSMDARRQQGDAIPLVRETEWQASPYELIDELGARRANLQIPYMWKMRVS